MHYETIVFPLLCHSCNVWCLELANLALPASPEHTNLLTSLIIDLISSSQSFYQQGLYGDQCQGDLIPLASPTSPRAPLAGFNLLIIFFNPPPRVPIFPISMPLPQDRSFVKFHSFRRTHHPQKQLPSAPSPGEGEGGRESGRGKER